jgi:hypothetical protein
LVLDQAVDAVAAGQDCLMAVSAVNVVSAANVVNTVNTVSVVNTVNMAMAATARRAVLIADPRRLHRETSGAPPERLSPRAQHASPPCRVL